MRFAAMLFLLAAPLSAAPVPKEMKAKRDADRLVGRWKPADGKNTWYEFRADGTMKTWNEPNEASAVPYRWTIDPTTTPKRMTWANGGTGMVEWEAVYELDGNDLRMTYAHTPKVPPGLGAAFGIVNKQTRETPVK